MTFARPTSFLYRSWLAQQRGRERRQSGAAPDPILSLFAGGKQGVYWRRSKSDFFQLSDGTTPAANTDPVGLIQDLSPNGNNPVQSDAASRGLLTANGVLLDGADDFYIMPAAVAGSGVTSQTITTALFLNAITPTDFLYSDDPSGVSIQLRSGGVVRTTGTSSLAETTSDIRGKWVVLSVIIDNGNSLTIRVNGVAEVNESIDSFTKGSVTDVILGAKSTSGANSSDAEVAGQVSIEAALSGSNVALVEQEFAGDVGVTLP